MSTSLVDEYQRLEERSISVLLYNTEVTVLLHTPVVAEWPLDTFTK